MGLINIVTHDFGNSHPMAFVVLLIALGSHANRAISEVSLGSADNVVMS